MTPTPPPGERVAVMLERAVAHELSQIPRVSAASRALADACRAALSAHPDDAPRHSNRQLRERERLLVEACVVYLHGCGYPNSGDKIRAWADTHFPSLPPAPRPWGPAVKLSDGDQYRTNGADWQWLYGRRDEWDDSDWPTIRTPSDFKQVEAAWLAAGGTFDGEDGR